MTVYRSAIGNITLALVGVLFGMAACGIDNDGEMTEETATVTSEEGGDWLYLPGGQGYVSWTWSSNRANLDNIYKVAWDTSCNSEGIYTKLGITNELSYYYEGPSVSDDCSSGYTWVGPTSYKDVAAIRRVRVIVCRDNFGSDECTVRDYYPPR